MQSQTLGLNQEGGERRHGLCRGTGELSRQRWVCAHALAGNAGGSPPPPEELLLGTESMSSAADIALQKTDTHRCAAAWPGLNDAAKASA